MDPVSEIRWASLGTSQIPIHGTDLTEARPRNRDPRHGRTFPFRLRDLCPCFVAELRGITDDKIATIIAGQRPGDLTRDEAVAYDLASALVSGGILPALTYQQAVRLFGEQGTAEFIYLVGLYCMVSVTLNGFDVPVPE